MKREIVERVDMTVPMEKSEKLMNYLLKYEYRSISSGPKRVSTLKYDTTKFHVIAERSLMKTYKDNWDKELDEEENIPHSGGV